MPLDQATPPLLRMAEWLADPARWDRSDADLPDDLRDAMAQSPRLRPLLNDWLAARRGLADLGLDSGFVDELDRSGDLRLAVTLVTEEDAVLDDAARFLGAALWSERARRMVLRSERERLAEQLGAEAMAFGLRRAPLLARPLVDLRADKGSDPVMAGRALCAALVAQGRRELFALFQMRFPDLPEPLSLTDRQAQAARAVLALRGIAA